MKKTQRKFAAQHETGEILQLLDSNQEVVTDAIVLNFDPRPFLWKVLLKLQTGRWQADHWHLAIRDPIGDQYFPAALWNDGSERDGLNVHFQESHVARQERNALLPPNERRYLAFTVEEMFASVTFLLDQTTSFQKAPAAVNQIG